MIDNLSFLEAIPVYKLALPAAIVLCAAFFRWRAGSSYLLLDRLLRIIFGRTPIYDTELRKLIRETHDLEQVRIRFRIPVMNTRDLKHLIEWCKAHSVGLHELRRIRDYVKPDTPKVIAPPPRSELWGAAIVFMIVIALFSFLFLVATVPAALTINKLNGHNYLMALDHAERLSLSSTQFTVESCAAGAAQTDVDKEICGFLTDSRYKEVIAPMIHKQREFGLFMLIVNFPMIWFFGGIFFAARRALKLNRRIMTVSKASPPPSTNVKEGK